MLRALPETIVAVSEEESQSTINMKDTRRFFIRDWSIETCGYRGENFKRLEGCIAPALRNWLVADLTNLIFEYIISL